MVAWRIFFNTRREILYLRTAMLYPLFIVIISSIKYYNLLNLGNNSSLIGSQRNRRNKSKLYLPWLHKYKDGKESTIFG